MNFRSFIQLVTVVIAFLGAAMFLIADAPYSSIRLTSRGVLKSHAIRIKDVSDVNGRLKLLNKNKSYIDFRVEQLINSTTAFIVGFLFIFLMTGKFSFSFIAGTATSAAIFFAADKSLSIEIEKSRRELEAEFPAIVELMSLSLSAGETPAQAMFRISERSQGHLALQFSRAVDEIRNGVPFHIALDEMGRRINSVVIRRFIDALVTAVVRGAPLVEVLQRHAVESRQMHKNDVMTKAGKAEISMMIPIVFLILPISILFALWPSLSTLNIFST